MSHRLGMIVAMSTPLRHVVVASVTFVAMAMLASLWAWPAISGRSGWVYPPDFWATVRDARYVWWGGLGAIYTARTGLVTLPGYAIALAPLAGLAGRLGLSFAWPFYPPRPTAWLLLGPVAFSSVAVVAAGVARLTGALGAAMRLRVAAVWATAALSVSPLFLWGHPEDVVALGLVCFSLAATAQARHGEAAWLVGFATLFQLYAALAVPLVVFAGPSGQRLRLAVKAGLLPTVLAAASALAAPQATWRVLASQPNFPRLDWATPLASDTTTIHTAPYRLAVLVLAVAAGWLWRDATPQRLVAVVGGLMVVRVLFEPVLVAYYLYPAAVLSVVLAARYGRRRVGATFMLAVASLVWANLHLRSVETAWWVVLIGLAAAAYAMATWPLMARTV